MKRGESKYGVFCATCHGQAGKGDGMIHKRALELQTPGWVQPTDLTSSVVVARENGHIYNTITNGIRNMMPYGHALSVDDRWAVVLYVRALQQSRQTQTAALDLSVTE